MSNSPQPEVSKEARDASTAEILRYLNGKGQGGTAVQEAIDQAAASLRERLETAKRDSARIDWLLAGNSIMVVDSDGPKTYVLHYPFDRKSIDSAMSQASGAEEKK